jgi:hypothetical protein
MADNCEYRSRRYRPPSPERLKDRENEEGPQLTNPRQAGIAPMALVPRKDRLGYISTRSVHMRLRTPTYPRIDNGIANFCLRSISALILNKVIGSGIFSGPPVVLVLLESKGATIMAWLIGGVVAWAG